MSSRPRRSAFTLIELLVVVAIIGILIAILLPALNHARQRSNITKCCGNLSAVGKATLIYAAESSDQFPAHPMTADFFGWWNYPTYAGGVDGGEETAFEVLYTDAGGGGTPYYPMAGDTRANFWLLVLKHYAGTASFVCPSDPASPKPALISYNGPPFTGQGFFTNFGALGDEQMAATCSYAFAYPWRDDGGQVSWWRTTTATFQPLAADLGPSGITAKDDPTGTPGKAISNSKNHGGTGQSVLFADGHAEFRKTNRAGPADDNIYTADNDQVYVSTGGFMFNSWSNVNASDQDVIMVPAGP